VTHIPSVVLSRMGNGRGACKVLMGKAEGKGRLGKRRRRWEGNINIDL
jgi:hypothetical protein